MDRFIYEMLRLVKERRLFPDVDLDNDLRKARLGLEGEEMVLEEIISYNPNGLIISDYNFILDDTPAQIDLLVITGSTWLVLEVKNYKTDFIYKNRRGYFDGAKDYMNTDIMSAFNRRLNMLDELVRRSGLEVDIVGLMVFSDSDTRIEIDSSVLAFAFEIIKLNELNSWLSKKNFLFASGKISQLSRIEEVLSRHERADFRFFPKPITEFDYSNFKKGVACSSCRYIGAEARRRHFYCPSCEHLEPKQDALVRCARELRTIFYHDKYIVTSKNMYKFMQGGISKQRIGRMLADEFEKNNFGKYTSYKVMPLRGLRVRETIGLFRRQMN